MIFSRVNDALQRMENRVPDRFRPALWPAILTAFLTCYFIVWHYSILRLGSSYVLADVAQSLPLVMTGYCIVSALSATIISLPLTLSLSRVVHRVVIILALLLFGASAIIRMFDWGALYFGGNHIDNNFWGHAFYADGLVFLFTKESLSLYAATALFLAGMLFILKRIARAGMTEDAR